MAQKQPFYRVVIQGSNGQSFEINKFTSIKFVYSLNSAGNAELQIPVNDLKINPITTSPLTTWIKIYRWDDKDIPSTEKLVWYGLLYDVSYGNEDVQGNVSLRYRDIAGILASRRVDRDYAVTTAIDASQILWDLIDTTQSKTAGGVVVGNLGITQGAAPASKNREPKKDLRSRTILDVMQSFSNNIDGIDWEITPTPVNSSVGIFNTYYRGADELYHKGNVISTPLVYHADDTSLMKLNNVQSASVDEVGAEYANDMLILAATVDESQLYAVSENIPQKKAIGLFQDVKSFTELSVQDTIDDRATEELNSTLNIPKNIDLKMLPLQQPRFGTFDVGDIFTVDYKNYHFREFVEQYRLYKLSVTVDNNGVEKMDFELAHI